MNRLALALLVLLTFGYRLDAGPDDDLMQAVPPDANTLVVVKVEVAYASPLARAEK